MIVERIWVGNSGRNFNYLVACPETREALAIDPLDHAGCLARARGKGWRIAQIVNTHEHGDHTGGNAALVAATGAKLLAHRAAGERIPGVDRGLADGDTVRVGTTVALEVLDTPGHTKSHVCLLARGEPPSLFSGDTLFNAGAGNCIHGGEPQALFATFRSRIAPLPDATRVYPGHDYLARNLGFTLDREPDNRDAARLLDAIAGRDGADAPVLTLGDERRINVFLRLDSPSVRDRLRAAFPDLPERPDAAAVFLRLRELRNRW